MRGDDPVGVLLRRMRIRPRPQAPSGLSSAEAARRTGLGGREPLTASFWLQVERGRSGASESKLLRMALALDADRDEVGMLFRAAGYGHLFDTLVAMGASARTPVVPHGAEAGILADPRLPYQKRRSLLAHLEDILASLPSSERDVASPEGSEDPDSD